MPGYNNQPRRQGPPQGQPHGQRPRRGGHGNGGNNPQNDLGPIPSPYNFVPLNEKVFFPAWAKQVSHDIPFQDGICGTLELEIEAKTSIYIRAGGPHPEKDQRRENQAHQRFFEVILPDGRKKFAIPGSSLKGMLRNLVTIASAGKLDALDNHRYGYRDLNNPEYRSHLTRKEEGKTYATVKTGWLSIAEGGQWQIKPCEYARVEKRDLQAIYRKETGNPCPCFQGGDEDNEKTAKHNYTLWGNVRLDFTYDNKSTTSVVKDKNGQPRLDKKGKPTILTYQLAQIHANGKQNGRAVFTGQPGSKMREFIFRTDTVGAPIPVENSVKKDFEFIHSNAKEEPNTDWNYWKGKLNSGEKVPVFYMTDAQGMIESIGLAQMYRLPFKHRVGDCRSADHASEKDDLAEMIFGYTKDKNFLRGRVQCETACAVGDPIEMPVVSTILNGPKPTYLPNYVEQVHGQTQGKLHPNQNRRYKSYNDDDARLRGFKRYYTRRGDKVSDPAPEAGQQNVSTKFRPLGSGTTFRGRVVFHNLRPAELGALLWALQFGDDPCQTGPCLHQIGMAKPYGYGSVSIHLLQESLQSWRRNDGQPVAEPLVEECLEAYIREMRQHDEAWSLDHPRIKALRTMADPQGKRPFPVKYPHFGMNRFDNEFNIHKTAEHILLHPVPECAWTPARAPVAALPPASPRVLETPAVPRPGPPRSPAPPQALPTQHRERIGKECEAEIMEEYTKSGKPKVFVPELGPVSKGTFSKGLENAPNLQPRTKVRVKILGAQENSYSYELLP